ncbi:glycosyltransferase family 4 protein [Pygmaiobacter massiliensis]|uniref:glycosyltransferase family 4 protein n=1 Tax=Pygmaiobacter massiliensis TaxID=1917873 RepID=UPI002899CF63|nr:glycosyltransferase family 4 protein [Pygmaiobacter massiliensis]
MNYCFFSAQYLPTFGGIERFTHNIAKELIERGDVAVVVTSALPNIAAHEVDENGIEIYRVPSILALKGRLPIALPGKKFRKAARAALAKADRVVIQTRFYPLSFLAASACRKAQKPYIIVEHGAGHLSLGGGLIDWCVQSYEHFFCWLLKRKTPAFYTVSEAGGEWLRHFGIQSSGVLYNFIDPVSIEDQTRGRTANAIRVQYNLPQDRPLVLFTGRLVEEKGILSLVEAIKALQNEPIPPVLAIAGAGPLEATLRAEPNCIRVLGTLPQSEVFALLKTAEVFCLPSKSEGMSTSVLEAAACGCYVVTTAVGGSKELISGPIYGTILRDDAPQTIAQALKQILDDEGVRKSAAQAAQQKVNVRFTKAATCTALQNIPWGQFSAY